MRGIGNREDFYTLDEEEELGVWVGRFSCDSCGFNELGIFVGKEDLRSWRLYAVGMNGIGVIEQASESQNKRVCTFHL